MDRPQVIITDYVHDELAPERELLADVAEIQALDAHRESELVGRIEQAEALMVYHNVSLTKASLQRLSRCRLIVRVGVGFDNVDGVYARQRGIPVANIPDYGTEEVADTAIGMMLTLTRGILQHQLLYRDLGGVWSYQAAAPLHRLRGRVFAIVGLGRIGSATALRAKALGMDVAFYDPYRADGHDKALGIRRCETLEELFRQAFVLSFHCPLTDETQQMLRAETIEWLPPGAYLVNTVRGPIVDTTILPDALSYGAVGGGGAGRDARRASRGRGSFTARLARSTPSCLPSADSQSAHRVLLRRGLAGDASQSGARLSASSARSTPAKSCELTRKVTPAAATSAPTAASVAASTGL